MRFKMKKKAGYVVAFVILLLGISDTVFAKAELEIVRIENYYLVAGGTAKIEVSVPFDTNVAVYRVEGDVQKLFREYNDVLRGKPFIIDINSCDLKSGDNRFFLQPTHRNISGADFVLSLVDTNDKDISHVRYFGYYHANGFPVDNRVLDKVMALDHTNICHVEFGEIEQLREVLRKVKDTKAKLIISLWKPFFTRQEGSYEKYMYGSGMIKLKKDWQKNWSEFKKAIKGYEDCIYAFYLDEPYWIGISEEDFIFVTRDVFAKEYPDIRRMSCLAAGSVYPKAWPTVEHPPISSKYIEYLTDIAFDEYSLDWQKDGLFGEYGRNMNAMKAIAKNNQRVWVVAKVFIGSSGPHKKTADLYDEYQRYIDFATADKSVVGVLNFSFCSGNQENWDIGAREFFDPNNKNYDKTLFGIIDKAGKTIIQH